MAITASDLIFYGSTGRPGNDTGLVGGGIDLTARPLLVQMSSAEVLELISSSSADVRTATVIYRTTDGISETWSPTIAGTCAIVLSTGVGEFLLTVDLSSASTAHTVSVNQSSGAGLHTINPGEVSAFLPFVFAISSGVEVRRYEKLFLRNDSTDTNLTSAFITLTSDESTQYRIGLSATKDSTDGWANRLTDPAYTWSDSTALSIPTTTLGFGEAIGVGIEQTLAANATEGHPSLLIQASGGTIAST